MDPASMPSAAPRPSARGRLLDVALSAIRTRGYAATAVDDLCAAAGVTKGAFFHHFASKEALAVAAAEHWSRLTGSRFESAPYHAARSARERVLGYLDFRASILRGKAADYTCLVGTMVQEVHDSSPAIRDACARSIAGHAATLESDIAQALADSGAGVGPSSRASVEPRSGAGVEPRNGAGAEADARSLALHTQAVLQGAFVLAKAAQDASVAAASIAHLRAYFELLFDRPRKRGRTPRPERRG